MRHEECRRRDLRLHVWEALWRSGERDPIHHQEPAAHIDGGLAHADEVVEGPEEIGEMEEAALEGERERHGGEPGGADRRAWG